MNAKEQKQKCYINNNGCETILTNQNLRLNCIKAIDWLHQVRACFAAVDRDYSAREDTISKIHSHDVLVKCSSSDLDSIAEADAHKEACWGLAINIVL